MDDQKWEMLMARLDRVDLKIETMDRKIEKLVHFKIKLTSLASFVTLALVLILDTIKAKFFK